MAITPETRDYRTFEVRALSADGSGEEQKYRVEGYAAVFDEETVLYEYDGIEYKGSHRQERVYGSGDARCRDEL